MLKYDSTQPFNPVRNFINRTRIYLYPSVVLLQSYPEFKKLKPTYLACSFNYNGILLYFDRSNTLGLHLFIQELKKNNEYFSDKLISPDIYCIEIRPDINYSAFEEGTYTAIYTPDQINKIFSTDGKTRKVLTKDPQYKEEFVKQLNSWFNTNYTAESLEIREDKSRVEIQQYDIPPCLNQEIYNYDREEPILKSGYLAKSRKTN